MTAPFRRVLPTHIPTVTEKGPRDTDAEVFLRVAARLDQGHDVGGSNVRAAVARLLRSAATALEVNNQPDPVLVIPRGGERAVSPSDHYAAAERLLAEAEGEMASPIFKHKLALAEIHALLANCPDPYDDEYDEQTALECMVARGHRVRTVETTHERL